MKWQNFHFDIAGSDSFVGNRFEKRIGVAGQKKQATTHGMLSQQQRAQHHSPGACLKSRETSPKLYLKWLNSTAEKHI